jgi:hypothetical protein
MKSVCFDGSGGRYVGMKGLLLFLLVFFNKVWHLEARHKRV